MQHALAILLALCLFTGSASAQSSDERIDLFDEGLMPLVEDLFGSDMPPTITDLQNLGDMVKRFNTMRSTTSPQKEIVMLDMNPLTWRTTLNDLVPETAAIAFCTDEIAGLNDCSAAAAHLRRMTDRCPKTVLGLIDLDVHDELVPLNLFQDAFPDPGDPNFIMLKRREEGGYLSPVRFAGSNSRPMAAAMVLCPEEMNPLKGFGLP